MDEPCENFRHLGDGSIHLISLQWIGKISSVGGVGYSLGNNLSRANPGGTDDVLCCAGEHCGGCSACNSTADRSAAASAENQTILAYVRRSAQGLSRVFVEADLDDAAPEFMMRSRNLRRPLATSSGRPKIACGSRILEPYSAMRCHRIGESFHVFATCCVRSGIHRIPAKIKFAECDLCAVSNGCRTMIWPGLLCPTRIFTSLEKDPLFLGCGGMKQRTKPDSFESHHVNCSSNKNVGNY